MSTQTALYQDICKLVNIDPIASPISCDLAQYSETQALVDAPANERMTASLQVFFEMLMEDTATIKKVDKALVDHLITTIDAKLGRALDEILHHQDFQALESLWRGLDYLLERSPARDKITVEIMDITKDDLLNDFEEAPDTTHSGLYQQVYTQEYDTPGGEPFSAIVSNYSFDKSPQDIALLRQVSRVAAAAHCPFLANVDAPFFGKEDFDEVMKIKDIGSYFEKAEFIRWQNFRKTQDSRYVGLAMPKFLLRLPYGDETVKVKSFSYQENVKSEDHNKYLWGAASFAFAANMSRSFRKHGWTVNIRGPESGGKVEALPLHQYDLGQGVQTKIPTEVSIPETRELAFADLGFIPLSFYKNSDFACFFSANSIQLPEQYDDEKAQANSRINSRLPYIFLVSRLAHYLKVLQRENIGSQKNKTELESELNTWLGRLVTKTSNPSPEVIARYPLSQANVAVVDIPSNPGYYKVEMSVVPHFQIEGMDITLSLVSQLPAAK